MRRFKDVAVTILPHREIRSEQERQDCCDQNGTRCTTGKGCERESRGTKCALDVRAEERRTGSTSSASSRLSHSPLAPVLAPAHQTPNYAFHTRHTGCKQGHRTAQDAGRQDGEIKVQVWQTTRAKNSGRVLTHVPLRNLLRNHISSRRFFMHKHAPAFALLIPADGLLFSTRVSVTMSDNRETEA